MNKIISIIALLLILPIFKVEAYDFVIDEITYNFTKEHGTVEVSGLREFLNLEPGDRNSSLPLVVNIPPVVTYKDNKYDVVSIGYAAFQGCRKVTEIKIPSTVREIGEFAFENCSKLEIINIPDSVKMIGRCTFRSVDSPSSSWTGALTCVYMTALNMILQWLLLIVTGTLFINWAYRK